MIRKYNDLLPGYLDGPNIRSHGAIIDGMNRDLDNKLNVLSQAFRLDRPLLFEEAENGVTVHINPQETIQKITLVVAGIDESFSESDDVTIETYSEDELVTNRDITVVVEDDEKLLVTVETYKEYTYERAYPENESINTLHSHDEFIDNIGKLYNIPRFISEDDFTYLSRLNYFREHVFTTDDISLLMLKVIYNLDENDVDVESLSTRLTSIPPYMYGLEDGNLIIGIPSDLVNETQKLIDKYTPITRKMVVRRPYSTHIGIMDPMEYMFEIVRATGEQSPWYPNTTRIIGFFNPNLINAPVTVKLDGTVIDTKNSDIEGKIYLNLFGVNPGYHNLVLEYEGEYEIDAVSKEFNFTVFDQIAREEACWNVGEYEGYNGTLVEPEFVEGDVIHSSEEELETGRGYLIYTPIFDYRYGNQNNFCVYGNFRLGDYNKYLGIIQVTENETSVKKDKGLFVNLCNYVSDTDLHEFCFDFVDNELYLYIDGEPVGARRDLSMDNQVWYLAAYNEAGDTNYSLAQMYTDDSYMYGAYPEINHKYWYVITGTGNRRAPEYDSTNDVYDVGRNDISVLTDYKILKETVDTTVEIDFNTQTRTGFRIGLVLNKTTTIGWYDSFFNASNDNVSTGNHTLKFVADENGVWKTYIDNNRTSTVEFTLTNDRNIGVLNYQAQAVKIKGIRIYKN